MQTHLLSWITFTPLAGALLVLLLPKNNSRLIKSVATAATLLTGALTVKALTLFNAAEPGFQMIEKAVWIPQFNVHYYLGTDGISFPMVFLTALISILACIGSFGIKTREKEYYFLYL